MQKQPRSTDLSTNGVTYPKTLSLLNLLLFEGDLPEFVEYSSTATPFLSVLTSAKNPLCQAYCDLEYFKKVALSLASRGSQILSPSCRG